MSGTEHFNLSTVQKYGDMKRHLKKTIELSFTTLVHILGRRIKIHRNIDK